MTRAHIAGINLVVVEVLALQRAFFISYEAILRYRGRIELHLQLDVLGNRKQRG